MAPPNRGPMVSRPETRQEIKSLPARAVTMVLWAPDTHGPWSAHSTTHISMNLVAYRGSRRLNQSSPMASATVASLSMSSTMPTPL